MLLSNQNIDYSSVRRIPTVKLTGQNQGTTSTTNTMPTSASLQDMSSHTQKFTWNKNENNKDQRLVHFPENLLPSNPPRQLTASQSDERIFEHPEVTIKPSALDDELQRRLLSIRTSNTTENLLERDARQSVLNTLEHPDMRAPVVMQPPLSSSASSSSTFLVQNDCKQVSRTQSADVYTTMLRTPSPGNRVEFFIDNQQSSKRSVSPGSLIGDILESPEHEKNEHPQISTSLTTTESICEYSKPSSKSDNSLLKNKKNDSW